MLKTTAMLVSELSDYRNPKSKIARMRDAGELVPITHGLYETDPLTPGYLLAQSIYGPSYLSFEYALSRHGLIPEGVFAHTCATCGKGRKKHYETPFGAFTYRDVPTRAFPLAVDFHCENGRGFLVASPEKALCDQLYKLSPVANLDELASLLFEDMRIDEEVFARLDGSLIEQLAPWYRSKNPRLLATFLRRTR